MILRSTQESSLCSEMQRPPSPLPVQTQITTLCGKRLQDALPPFAPATGQEGVCTHSSWAARAQRVPVQRFSCTRHRLPQITLP